MSEQPPRRPEGRAGGEAGAKQSSGFGAVVLHHTVTALMLALILALGVWAYLTFRKTSFFEAPDDEANTRVEAHALQAQLQRIRFGLGVYFRFDGRYPAALEELVERGLLLPSDLYYPSGTARYDYQRTASGYTLELASSQ
ncbi:hypothetical protein FIV42_29035 [Persicimonas caeni]|uniref:Type II secretion system protein GspG C-terminal domain-containing protein n=1 Tax=Persicimonas caeni TaxID=2292766 RepID=A0A4Y6Q230_PERCE|nr:hypothetical protein [Persicimonas caeni]QDG54644.1 hypothetical protein FIV42_29035 [Persicimonas caeni]QED35865.1 hypothetical protein FRD00_29030 [Persicimonas caeni]